MKIRALVRNSLVPLYFKYFDELTAVLLHKIARSQVSDRRVAQYLGLLPFLCILYVVRRLRHKLPFWLSQSGNNIVDNLQAARCSSRSYHRYVIELILFNSSINKITEWTLPNTMFAEYLKFFDFSLIEKTLMAHYLMERGKKRFALEVHKNICDLPKEQLPQKKGYTIYNNAAVCFFLNGDIKNSNKYWKIANTYKVTNASYGRQSFRILGQNWFIAIGHFAALGYYLKYNRLYKNGSVFIVAPVDLKNVPGYYLAEYFIPLGVNFIQPDALEETYDKWALKNSTRTWFQLTQFEREAMVDDFWAFDFFDGEVLGFAHAFNKIQIEWEQNHEAPICVLSEEDRLYIRQMTQLLGIPKDAWYVCLHVREPGFHANWNQIYPTLRDSDIADYQPTIDAIVQKGGWVIRMGDSSMKPLFAQNGVVDFAHSKLKSQKADVLLPAAARFFLGTNSGLALIPELFGVQNLFTNWVPVGLPMWASKDYMMPKSFFNKTIKKKLSIKEVFENNLAYIQMKEDLPTNIEVVDNTSAEILEFVESIMNLSTTGICKNASNLDSSEIDINKFHSYFGNAIYIPSVKQET